MSSPTIGPLFVGDGGRERNDVVSSLDGGAPVTAMHDRRAGARLGQADRVRARIRRADRRVVRLRSRVRDRRPAVLAARSRCSRRACGSRTPSGSTRGRRRSPELPPVVSTWYWTVVPLAPPGRHERAGVGLVREVAARRRLAEPKPVMRVRSRRTAATSRARSGPGPATPAGPVVVLLFRRAIAPVVADAAVLGRERRVVHRILVLRARDERSSRRRSRAGS